jgi:hypothetical protein
MKKPLLMVLGLLVWLACCEKKEVRKQLYFEDLKPPVGVKVKIVNDVSMNPQSGGEVDVIAAVDPDIDKDELDRMMKSFWRQVKDRSGFVHGKADKISIRFYPGAAKAKAAGNDWLAKVAKDSLDGKAAFINHQKAPLIKWAKKALGKQPQFTGKLKPQLLANPVAMELEIKVPFIENDGSGAYRKKLSHTIVTTEFSTYTQTLFDKIEGLKKLTFVGIHDDKEVIRVWMTRSQYQQLDLRNVEESLGAYQGKFIEPIMSKAISEKVVEKKVAKQRLKVYRETFARLPAEQVQIDKRFK